MHLRIRVLLLWLAAGVLLPACGGGSGTEVTPEPLLLGILCDGGSATGTANTAAGGAGGTLALYSRGGITVTSATPPSAPILPPTPLVGTTITSADLNGVSYTQASGHLLIKGSVTTPAVATYTLTCTAGDIVVSGQLTSGDGAGAAANLVLNAPAGTVFVSGRIYTMHPGGSAGSLQISANRIVVTGEILSQGWPGGGNGGSVSLSAAGGATADVLIVNGTIMTDGGFAATGIGGAGGNITIEAANAVSVHAPDSYGILPNYVLYARGGGAGGTGTQTGGDGGSVTIRGVARVTLYATIDISGGSVGSGGACTGGASGILSINQDMGNTGPVLLYAWILARGGVTVIDPDSSPSTDVKGGPGGGLYVGSSAGSATPGAPSSVTVAGSITLSGGTGATTTGTGSGGSGGSATLTNDYGTAGNLAVRDSITNVGGYGSANGGIGGSFTMSILTGDITVESLVQSSGGTATVNGGDGGTATLSTVTGDVLINSSIWVLGGTGNPTGGGGGGGGGNGGTATLSTVTGDIVVTGSVWASGGAGFPQGGTGGLLDVSIGNPAVATSGNFTLAGGLNVDGGIGWTGGNAGLLTVSLRDSTVGVSALSRALLLRGSFVSSSGGIGGGRAREGRAARYPSLPRDRSPFPERSKAWGV